MAGSVRVRAGTIRLRIDHPAAHKIGMDHAGFLVTNVTRQTLNRAIILTPVNTGNLRSHNRMRVQRGGNEVRGEVFNEVEYAGAVHDGSGPYIIRPRRKKALRFEVGGQVVFAKRVRHPGTKGRPWLARAAQEVAVAQGFTWTPE